MKKIYSLIRACMTSDMNIFKIKTKNGKSNSLTILFISLCLMSAIWSYANMMFEKLAPLHLQFVVLSVFVFSTALFTIVQGIYKSSSLMFNCRDDQLLLSLPIKKQTVLFVRIFKFYLFELLFDTLFIIPLVVAYIRWADTISWTFFLISFIVLLMLPIIPIVISCIIGVISASISSRFKYKNLAEIVISMIILVGVLYISFNIDHAFTYLAEHANSINDLITKIYYPAGAYASLVINFNIKDLLIFIFIHLIIFIITLLVLSKFYFKINSRLKKVVTSKKVKINDLVIKSHSKNSALIRKEISTFFKIPVFIINAGFGLLLFILVAVVICFKYDSFITMLNDPSTIGFTISNDIIMNNTSIIIFGLISFTSYMTSITSSVISLEGRNINIVKSLPIKTRTILMSKIYSSLVLTTPILFIGDIILFIKFGTNIIEAILLLILSILIPLVSHFIGILINLKYPKLDYENATEVVKQSASTFTAVMIGMILFVITFVIIGKVAGNISNLLFLVIAVIIYIIFDSILYLILNKFGVKLFNKLSI